MTFQYQYHLDTELHTKHTPIIIVLVSYVRDLLQNAKLENYSYTVPVLIAYQCQRRAAISYNFQ